MAKPKKQQNTNSIGVVFNMNKPHEHDLYWNIVGNAKKLGLNPATYLKMVMNMYYNDQLKSIGGKTETDSYKNEGDDYADDLLC